MNFVIREAVAADVPLLAQLHVTTYNETHAPILRNGPTYAVRERQWRAGFEKADGNSFCFVVESPNDELVGFARGIPYDHPDHPEYDGELNKIYVLRKYHRQGIGRMLLAKVARTFLGRGKTSMLLFGDARNRSNGFYERMGAERLYAKNGQFHGGYGWRHLRPLVDMDSDLNDPSDR
jgi:GNAT superfamily N-acetyltransferase